MATLHARVQSWAAREDAERRLWIVALAEGIVWPFMAEVMLAPMVVLKPEKAWRYAFICTVGSVVGAMVAFLLGWLLWLTVGKGIVMVLGLAPYAPAMVEAVREIQVIAVLSAGVGLVPFKWVALGLGVGQANLVVCLVAALIARGARFWWIAWFVWRKGRMGKGWMDAHLHNASVLAGLAVLYALCLLHYLATGG